MDSILRYINTRNIPYSEIIIIAISLIFGFFSFLSLNFYTLGKTAFSLQWAFIIGLGLGTLAYLAKRFKQVHCKFKVYLILEILTLVIFSLAFILLSATVFSHYFNVTANKTQIQSELKKVINETQLMFSDYEDYGNGRIELYKQTLQSVAQNKIGSPSDYIAYGFDKSGISDSLQIENKIFIIRQDLFPPEYVTIKNQKTLWYNASSKHVDNWKAIGVVDLVNDFDKISKDWQSKLETYSLNKQLKETPSVFPISNFKNIDPIKATFQEFKTPGIVPIILSIVFYGLMLLAWAIAPRSTKRGLPLADYEIEL